MNMMMMMLTIMFTRITERRTTGCTLAQLQTHTEASTTPLRLDYYYYHYHHHHHHHHHYYYYQVQSTSRGCHPEKPSIMKGQPGNHTVLVGSNLTLPCELMVRMAVVIVMVVVVMVVVVVVIVVIYKMVMVITEGEGRSLSHGHRLLSPLPTERIMDGGEHGWFY